MLIRQEGRKCICNREIFNPVVKKQMLILKRQILATKKLICNTLFPRTPDVRGFTITLLKFTKVSIDICFRSWGQAGQNFDKFDCYGFNIQMLVRVILFQSNVLRDFLI